MSRHAAGFTLLEVLIAISLIALVMTFGYSSVTQLAEAERRTLDENGRDRLAEVVLDRMERELVGTLLLVRPEDVPLEEHPWLFTSRDGVFEGGDADTLRFVTETPARVGGSGGRGGFRMVTYAPRADRDGRLALFRAEEILPPGLPTELPAFDDPPVVEGLARFNVTLIDEKTPTRLADWDSTSEDQADRLPGSVELALQLISDDPTGERVAGTTYTRRVPLKVRPLGEEATGDCDGPTVSECVARFGELIQTLGPAVQTAIEELQAGVDGDACFTAGAQSEELQALTGQLFELTQLDPTEICQ